MGDKVKSLIVAIITVMLCIAIMATGTFALFTDSIDVKTHLYSGELDATLVRTKLTKVALNDDGILEKFVDETTVDFTTDGIETVFSTTADDLMVPLSYYEAEMVVTNKGDVAFEHDIRITFDGADADNLKFAEQLLVEVFVGDAGTKIKSGSLQGIKDNEVKVADKILLKPGESQKFTVKITFQNLDTDGSINNTAMNQTANFDLAVYAVQYSQIIDNTQSGTVTP